LHNSDNIHDHDYIKSLKQPAYASKSDKTDRPTTSKVLHAVPPALDPGVVINDCVSGINDVREVVNDTDYDDDDIPTDINAVVDTDLPVEYKCDTANLLIEQKRDTSLQQAWTLAAQNKNGYRLSIITSSRQHTRSKG